MEKIDGQSFSLRDFCEILFSHKTSIVIIFLSMVVTVIAGVLIWPETYEARASLLIKMGRENVSLHTLPPSSQQQVLTMGLRREDIKSEIEILDNKYIIEKVVKKLGTDFIFPEPVKPETSLKIKYELQQIVFQIKDFLYEILYSIDLKKRLSPFEKAVVEIQENLLVRQLKDTDVIEVKFKWSNPGIASGILDCLIDFYLKHHLEAHRHSGGYDFLKKQVEVIGNNLNDSENRMQLLKEKEAIISYDEQKRFLLKQITDFTGDLKKTQTKIANTTAKVNELKSRQSLGISDYYKELKGLQIELLSQEQLLEMSDYHKELKGELISQEVTLKGLNAEGKNLKQHIDSYRKDLERLNIYDIELKQLYRQIQIDEFNFKLYKKKLEEARITDVLDVERIVNVKVIEPATSSFIPTKPKKKVLIMGLGTVLSLVFGVCFAFLLTYIDHSFRTAEDVNQYLKLPLLASIKEDKKLSEFKEYEKLKNNFYSLSSGKPIKSVMVSSSISGEGCSTVAINFAKSLARSRSVKVCLIDGNFRKPVLHEYFKLDENLELSENLDLDEDLEPDNYLGLSDLFLGKVSIHDVLIKTKYSNLSIIPNGKSIVNPVEVFESQEWKGIIEKLKEEFDYIVFDSAPVNVYPDAHILANLMDGALLVIHMGKTRWQVAQKAKEQLEMNHTNILGVALNRSRHVIPEFIYRRL